MRYLPSKRLVWLVVPLVPLAVMFVGLQRAGQPHEDYIATRGLRPPVEQKFSVVDPESWSKGSRSGGWFGQGMEALETWQYNPWKKQRYYPGALFDRLSQSDKPEDRAEYERLMQLAREWHARILTRFPELAMAPETPLPDGKNGFLKLHELLKRLNAEEKGGLRISPFPRNLAELRTPFDLAMASACVEANRALIEELRSIGLMPDGSSAGIVAEDWFENSRENFKTAHNLLLIDARLAAMRGDTARALESIRAASGLADHVRLYQPSLWTFFPVSAGLKMKTGECVLTAIIPSLPPDQVDLAAWEAAANQTVRPPTDYAEDTRAEWNFVMINRLLPLMADPSNTLVPRDADLLVETYTVAMRDRVVQASSMTLEEMRNHPLPVPSMSQLSDTSRYLANALCITERSNGKRQEWETVQASAGLTRAAFEILADRPVPRDPVSGLPYVWRASIAHLSLPRDARFGHLSLEPISLPSRKPTITRR